MDERSDEIRNEIEETREQMGETVEALTYKANVPRRAKDWVSDKKEAVVDKVSGTKDAVVSTVSDATPDGQAVKQRAGRMKDTAERNPLGLAIAGAAAGFIAGLLAPPTRVEDERLGPMSDDVKSAAADAGSEALERGKQVAQEAVQTATETAKERGREEGQELASTLQEQAGETVSPSDPERASYPR